MNADELGGNNLKEEHRRNSGRAVGASPHFHAHLVQMRARKDSRLDTFVFIFMQR